MAGWKFADFRSLTSPSLAITLSLMDMSCHTAMCWGDSRGLFAFAVQPLYSSIILAEKSMREMIYIEGKGSNKIHQLSWLLFIYKTGCRAVETNGLFGERLHVFFFLNRKTL
jgi:hypothetical protein